jgi:hypothetical protein
MAGLLGALGTASKVIDAAAPLAQTGFAAGQMIAGAMNRKKAESMIPSLNAAESQLLNTARRRRRALETGSAATADRNAVKQMAAQYGQGAFRSGGPVNTGVLAQLMNQGMANISNQYGQQYAQAFAEEGKIAKDISNFYNDVAFLKSARKSAQAENQMQAGQQNLLASLGGGKFYGQQG